MAKGRHRPGSPTLSELLTLLCGLLSLLCGIQHGALAEAPLLSLCPASVLSHSGNSVPCKCHVPFFMTLVRVVLCGLLERGTSYVS